MSLFLPGTMLFSQAQVLRIATSPSAIATQVPGYSQVTAINTKTIAYTPSVPTSYPSFVSASVALVLLKKKL